MKIYHHPTKKVVEVHSIDVFNYVVVYDTSMIDLEGYIGTLPIEECSLLVPIGKLLEEEV